MSVDPSFSRAEDYFQAGRSRRQLEILPVGVKDAIADNAAEILREVLRCIGSVKAF